MPAHVELFERVNTPVDKVYLDSSFIIPLISYIKFSNDPEFIPSKNFYDKLISHNTKMWTSILGLEEVIWHFVKGFRNNEKSQNLHRQLSWSNYKEKYPEEYRKTIKKSRRVTVRTFKTFSNFGIQVHIPERYRENSNSKINIIIRYAKAILRLYPVEPMDAFQIAIAKSEGTKFIASNDTRFQDIDNICIYSSIRIHSN